MYFDEEAFELEIIIKKNRNKNNISMISETLNKKFQFKITISLDEYEKIGKL